MSEVTILQLSLLGSPHILVNNQPLEVDRHKAIALLIYLAVTGERHQRQTLAALLWPEYDSQRAHANLRHVLWVLKKGIGQLWLEIDRSSVSLRPGFALDTKLFIEKIQTAQRLVDEENTPAGSVKFLALFDEAVKLYRDTFLAGFTLPNAPDFDDWQRFQAQYYRQVLETALQFLVAGYSQQKKWNRAIHYGQRWLALDTFHEPAHVQLMHLYLQAGKKASAIRQYEICHRILTEEFGTSPQTETVNLYQKIRADGVLPDNNHSLTSPSLYPRANVLAANPLPVQLTPFFGRQEELTAITKRLENPFCRLLTITGSGGMGKTRLAIQIARQQAEAYAHGTYFVPLTAVASANFLVAAIADALQLSFSPGKDPQAQLLAYLQHKEMLLVMDNFEHLLDEAEFLLEILKNAPAVKLLVTSRECLDFQVEWLYTIQGLPFPTHTQNSLAQYSAVELFVHHARRVCPTYEFLEDEQTAVLRICQLLDGMPLGIELAAALRRTFDSADIADEIQHNLDFLTTSMRDLPERHRSLRAIFEHSWSLLSVAEKDILKQLSIFRGSFGLEAAVQVAQADSSILITLVNKSFLNQLSESRYEMHESLRQFATKKLDEDALTLAEVQARYGLYYAHFLQQREPALRGKGQKEALGEIREEVENIHAAWHWNVEQHRRTAVNHSLNSLMFFYDLTGRSQEGRDTFAWAANIWQQQHDVESDKDAQLDLARLQARQAGFDNRLSRYEEAVTLIEKNLAVFRRQPVPIEIVSSLIQLGTGFYFLGRYEESVQAFNESLAMSRELCDLMNQGGALIGLGNIYCSLGYYDKARTYLEEGLNKWRELGNRRGVAIALSNLSSMMEAQGDYLAARTLQQESLTIKQAYGERRGVAISSLNLGCIEFRLGEHTKAMQLLNNSLVEFQEIGEFAGSAFCLMNLGNVAYAQGDLVEAKAYYKDCLNIATDISNRRAMAYALNDLGNVAYDLQEYDESKQYFQQALQFALEIQSLPHVMEALVGMAMFLSQLELFEEAIIVLSFVLKNPVTDQECKDKGEKILIQLLSQIPSQVRLAAQEQGGVAELTNILDILTENSLH